MVINTGIEDVLLSQFDKKDVGICEEICTYVDFRGASEPFTVGCFNEIYNNVIDSGGGIHSVRESVQKWYLRMKENERKLNKIAKKILWCIEMKMSINSEFGGGNIHFQFRETDFCGTWDELIPRQEIMAKFIGRDDRSVLDLGAGQMFLKTILPPKVTYYPVDYFKRFENTLVSDFTKYQFPNIYTDVAFCSGVLEYIADYRWFIKEVCQHCRKIIISYATTDRYPHIETRRKYGWGNDLTEEDIIIQFAMYGKRMTNSSFDKYQQQNIFVFQ